MNKVTCSHCGSINNSNSRYCIQCGYELPKPQPEIASIQRGEATHPKPDKRKKSLGILLGMMVFGLSYWGVQQVFFKQPPLDKIMVQTASELNKTYPIMVDQYTRLDNAVALPDNKFQYNYTLVDLTKSEVNLDTIKKYVDPEIINNVRTDPGMKFFRDHKITLIYSYKDKNGEFVYKLLVTPQMYQ